MLLNSASEGVVVMPHVLRSITLEEVVNETPMHFAVKSFPILVDLMHTIRKISIHLTNNAVLISTVGKQMNVHKNMVIINARAYRSRLNSDSMIWFLQNTIRLVPIYFSFSHKNGEINIL